MKISILVLSVFLWLPFEISSSVSATQDPEFLPRFEYSEALGCGDVFFHAVNDEATEVLRIEADFSQLHNSRGRRVIDLAKLPAAVVIEIDVYRTGQLNRPNCRDLHVFEEGTVPETPAVWRPFRGRLEVERGPKGARSDAPWLFKARLRLVDAAFRGPGGRVLKMERPFTWEGFVGWQAG